MNTKKRILASLAALVLCLTLLPVVQRANAAFVDLQFEPYELDPDDFDIEDWNNYKTNGACRISEHTTTNLFMENFQIDLLGEVTLPAGVTPGSITVTKMQWSPGPVFDPNKAHDPVRRTYYGNYGVRWKDEAKRLAEVGIVEIWENVIPEMEGAGLKNTDPFTVRATLTWSGGEYTLDHTFDSLRDIDDLAKWPNNYIEGLEEPPAAVKAHGNGSYYVLRYPSVKKNGDGTFDLTLSYLVKKDKPTNEYSSEHASGGNAIYIYGSREPNVFGGGQAYPARGVITMSNKEYHSLVTFGFTAWHNYDRDGDFPSESDYYRYTKTLTFNKGDTVSIAAGRTTSYWPDNSSGAAALNSGTYYHSPAYTYNYTFGDEAPETHTLTINYALAGGLSWPGGAPEPYTEQIMEGVTYNIPSPEFAGLAPDIEAVTGTMGKSDVTVTVTYGTAHTLTVNYQLAPGVSLPAGRSLPSACVMQVLEGGTYTVKTPRLGDLVPDKEIVIGEMGTEDKSETVTYYGRLSVIGEVNGDELTYTVRYCPANALLLAARYGANGRMTYASTVAVPSGDSQDTLIMGGAGGKYKLLLVDRTTFAPLCRAWESAEREA